MEPQRVVIDDLGGGLNEGGQPSQIADNQFVLLDNFFPFERRIIRRNGSFKKSTAAYSQPLTGLVIYRTSAGNQLPMFGTPEGFARYSPPHGETGVILSLPRSNLTDPTAQRNPGVINYSLLPWVFVQMNGFVYAMRALSTALLRLSSSSYYEAGIVKPLAACTIAVNAAGNMTAGDRTVVYTFRNSTTGAESNYSDASNLITLGADDSIDVSGVAISSNPQVNQRRLYVNAPGTDAVWLYAGDINDNVTTTANINKRVSELGHLASVKNGLPPANLIAGDVFLDSYLVATDGTDLFVSEPFKPESFYEFNVFDVFKNDGHKIVGVRSFGDRVIVGKTNKTHYFTLLGNRWSRDTLSEDMGCYSHHSMQAADGRLFWYAGNDIAMYDGASVHGIGTTKVKKLLARIPAIRKPFVTATVYPKLGLYLLSCHIGSPLLSDPSDTIDIGTFPGEDAARPGNNCIIVLNYRTGAWSTFTYPSPMYAPVVLVYGHGPNQEQVAWAIFPDNNFYQMDRGGRDGDALIDARFRTKAYRFTPFGLLAAVRRVFLKVTTVASTITLRLYRDEKPTAVKERTGLSLADLDFTTTRPTKGFNMFVGKKGATWQLEGQYQGEPTIEIESIAFEAMPRAERVTIR
jgi:hypothetical protein